MGLYESPAVKKWRVKAESLVIASSGAERLFYRI